MSATLRQKFYRIRPKLARELGLTNLLSVPRVLKVVINAGIGDIKDSREGQEQVIDDIAKIAGQKPSLRRAHRAVAGFGIRQGQIVGVSVTLRGDKMYDFLNKLFNIVFPRIRDFRGVPRNSFDLQGNYTIGLLEHTVFPEIDLGTVGKVRGLEVIIVTSGSSKNESLIMLEALGMPFEKENNG